MLKKHFLLLRGTHQQIHRSKGVELDGVGLRNVKDIRILPNLCPSGTEDWSPENEPQVYPDGCSRYLLEHESMVERLLLLQ